MTPPVRSPRDLDEALSRALEDLEAGLDLPQILHRYEAYTPELAPLLETAVRLRGEPWAMLSMSGRVRGRERLHAALQERQAPHRAFPALWRQLGAALGLLLLAGVALLAWPGDGPIQPRRPAATSALTSQPGYLLTATATATAPPTVDRETELPPLEIGMEEFEGAHGTSTASPVVDRPAAATATRTRIPTASPTSSAAVPATVSPTLSATHTVTPTATMPPTNQPEPPEPSDTATPTATLVPSPTNTPVPGATKTGTPPRPPATIIPIPTETETPEPTATETAPAETVTPQPSATPQPSGTPEPSRTPEPTGTPDSGDDDRSSAAHPGLWESLQHLLRSVAEPAQR